MTTSRREAFAPGTVEIRPPSLRDETTIVVRLAVAIVVLVGFYLANTAWNVDPRAARAAGLLPFQKLVADTPSADQRMFRELQEGLLEAERLKTTTGAWPSPAALADAGIPPFAADPTVKGSTYRWFLTHRGAYVNYRGMPNTPGAPTWLVHVQEPVPGTPPDPSPEDEEHHRLPGGILLHVSIWMHPNGERLSPALIPLPQNEGWIQLRVNAPTPGYLPPPVTRTP